MHVHDVVVVGAGHNGLVAANYLRDAGLDVLVLEARDVVGGACVTEELIPGARWSSCAFIQSVFHPRIAADLELSRHGLSMYAPEVQGFAALRDGRHLFLWQDIDATLREIERHSAADAGRFLKFGSRLRRFGEYTASFQLGPPPPRSEVLRIFEEAGEQDLYDEFVTMAVGDVLDRYFESDIVKGFLAFFGVVSFYGGPSTPGTSYLYGHHASGEFDGHFGRWAYVRGGMGGISEALRARAESRGVTIRTGVPVTDIMVRDGRASGVVLAGGEEIAARHVVSNVDPRRTFLELLPTNAVPSGLRTKVEQIDTRGSMARIHLLVDQLPAYNGVRYDTPGPHNAGHQLLGATADNFELAWEAMRRGTLPDDYVIEAITQSATDDSLAPSGMHTLTLGVQQLPSELTTRGGWDAAKESWADAVMEVFYDYAPGMRGHVQDRYVITPKDLEREYGMSGGNINHVAMSGNQVFGARPVPELSQYSTPLAQLYLCGAGLHPGGGVTGIPGHNAAHTLLADLRGDGATPARTSRQRSRRSLTDRILDHPAGQQLGHKLARRRALRPFSSLASRTRRR